MEVKFHCKSGTEIMLHAHMATHPFVHKKGVNKIMSQIIYPLIMTII